MAQIKQGIMGPVSGKVGNLVYYISKGKNFVRRAPLKSKKRPTIKQKIHRSKFGEVTRFIAPLAKLVNESYRLINRRQTGTNVLFKEVYREALIGKYPHFSIDYARVKLFNGKLPWSMCTLHPAELTSKIDLTWEVSSYPEFLDDELILLVRSCANGEWYIKEGLARRGQGNCTVTIDIPVESSLLHLWMIFRSPDRRAYSCSEYLGRLLCERMPFDEE